WRWSVESRARLSARQRVRHLRHLQPAELGRFDLGAVASDALGQSREPGWVARVKISVVQSGFVGRDLRFQPLDFARKAIIVALVLVGELPPRLRGGGSAKRCRRGLGALHAAPSTIALCATVPLPVAGRNLGLISLPDPVLIAAGDHIDLARTVEAERDCHRSIEKISIMTDDQYC